MIELWIAVAKKHLREILHHLAFSVQGSEELFACFPPLIKDVADLQSRFGHRIAVLLEMLQDAENANRATDRRYPSLLDVLAEAYFAAGRTDEAIATAIEARDLARQVNAPELEREIEGKLQRYRAGG